MTKTQRIENLTNDDCIKPKWQRNSEKRTAERMQREQETREAQRERNKKINALKKKWIKKLEDCRGLYNRHDKRLEMLRDMKLPYTKTDNWVSGRNVGMLDTLEELIKDLSEI